jgi:hypothetical protein
MAERRRGDRLLYIWVIRVVQWKIDISFGTDVIRSMIEIEGDSL